MTETAFKKKSLEKTTQKTSHQKTCLTTARLQRETIAPPADETCIPDQGDRGRVMVFIDGANLFYAASHLSIEIDYVKLLHYLTARDRLVHVFFYTGYDPTDEKQLSFLRWMSHRGFRVVTKAVTRAANGAKSANLDVEIAVDMMSIARQLL